MIAFSTCAAVVVKSSTNTIKKYAADLEESWMRLKGLCFIRYFRTGIIFAVTRIIISQMSIIYEQILSSTSKKFYPYKKGAQVLQHIMSTNSINQLRFLATFELFAKQAEGSHATSFLCSSHCTLRSCCGRQLEHIHSCLRSSRMLR